MLSPDHSGVGDGPSRERSLQHAEVSQRFRRSLRIEPIPRRNQTLRYIHTLICILMTMDKFMYMYSRLSQVSVPALSYPTASGYLLAQGSGSSNRQNRNRLLVSLTLLGSSCSISGVCLGFDDLVRRGDVGP